MSLEKKAVCGWYLPNEQGIHLLLLAGAVVVSEKIAQHFEDNTLWSGLTYSAHPLSCASPDHRVVKE